MTPLERWRWSYCQDASGPATSVLTCLAYHHNARTGRCDPSLATIAEATGYSQRHVRRSLNELVRLGLVTRNTRVGKSAEYHLQFGDEDVPTPDRVSADRVSADRVSADTMTKTPDRSSKTPDRSSPKHVEREERSTRGAPPSGAAPADAGPPSGLQCSETNNGGDHTAAPVRPLPGRDLSKVDEIQPGSRYTYGDHWREQDASTARREAREAAKAVDEKRFEQELLDSLTPERREEILKQRRENGNA